jgi:hypothetical protein
MAQQTALLFCARCNKQTEHTLERIGLEFVLPCQEEVSKIVLGEDKLPVLDDEGHTQWAPAPCEHAIKFPKTRDIAELGKWVADYNEVNVPALLSQEVSEDEAAMDDIIKGFQ